MITSLYTHTHTNTHTHTTHTLQVECIPDLVNLRIINNVVYFVGRAIAEEDDISALTTRAGMYAARCKWVVDNRDEIVKIIDGHMRKYNPNYA